MRLGILGGSFDPPHVGHLLAASDACEQLELDRLVLVPAAVQPLKRDRRMASPAQRLEMVRRLVGDDPRLAVDPVEIEREGLSYTVDTLARFAELHPEAERFFLVGMDVLESWPRWREPERIQQLATVAVMVREGEHAEASIRDGMLQLRTRRVDVSSTEIRARVQAGRSIHGFVPDAVAAFIAAERLYR